MLQLWEQYIQVHAVSFCFNMLCIHKHKEILQAVWINFTKISEEKKISTCETYSMLQMQWHTYTYYMIYWFRNTCTRCRIRRNIEMIRCSVSRQNLDISTITTPNIHSGQKCKNNAILWCGIRYTFLSNHNIYKSSLGHCIWGPDFYHLKIALRFYNFCP